MKIKSIQHIAIAVRDLEKSKRLYTTITGAAASQTTEVPDQKVKVCLLETGTTRIELIAPLEGNTSLLKFLEKRGEGVHHICLAVGDVEEALRECRQQGIRLIDEVPRVGAGGHKIAFLHPESTGGLLIELEEEA